MERYFKKGKGKGKGKQCLHVMNLWMYDSNLVEGANSVRLSSNSKCFNWEET